MKQIGFIVGTGRCGTTVLSQALNSHSRICVPHELQIIVSIGNGDRLYDKYVSGEFKDYRADDFIRLIEDCCPYHFGRYFDYVGHFKEDLRYPQMDLRELLTGLFDHICYSYKKDVFLEQTPWYGQRLDILRDLFPGMKVIHVVRDGRDVAVSFSRTPWWSKNIKDNLLQWEKEVNVIHDFGGKNQGAFIETRYEDLVTNPKAELGKILGLFGLDFEDEMLDPGRLMDYSFMFRGTAEEYQSNENKRWVQSKKTLFFSDSIGVWERRKGSDFANLPQNVKDTLALFHYQI